MKHRAHAHHTRFRARHSSTRYRHVVAKVLALALTGSLGFGVVFAQTVATRFENSFDARDISGLLNEWEPPPVPDADPDDPLAGRDVNILIIGSDARTGDNAKLGGLADLSGMRGDATVLLHISADRTRIEAMSIPRDMRVRVADCTRSDGTFQRGWTGKFNIAFANGGKNGDVASGAACAINTVREWTGIRIDHFLVMDFAGFRGMIDALDGIPMCIPNDIKSPKARLDLKAGPQVLNGKTALAWARARTGTGTGDGTDLMRIARQQQLMENTFRKAMSMNLFTDAGKLTEFARATANSMTVDEQLSDTNYLIGLALSLASFDTKNLTFVTIPWKYAGDKSGDILPQPQAETLFAQIAADKPISLPSAVPKPSPTSEPSPEPTEPEDEEEPPRPYKRIPLPDELRPPEEPPAPTLQELGAKADEEILASC